MNNSSPGSTDEFTNQFDFMENQNRFVTVSQFYFKQQLTAPHMFFNFLNLKIRPVDPGPRLKFYIDKILGSKIKRE